MALNILFSSIGFGMYSHECLITKRKQFSLTDLNPACSKTSTNDTDNKATFKKASCCKLTQEYKKLSQSSQFKVAKFLVDSHITVLPFPTFTFETLTTSKGLSSTILSNAPPLTRKQIRAKLQVYII